MTPEQIKATGAQIILSNTYHLNLRPGSALVQEMGGLHRFMGWDKPILTDSGGFQVFSLSELRKVREDGIEFRSHLDGAPLFLGRNPATGYRPNWEPISRWYSTNAHRSPAIATPVPTPSIEPSVGQGNSWITPEQTGSWNGGTMFLCIIQGSTFDDLRRNCAEALVAMDFPGYAVGGVSVGEPEPELLRQVAVCAPVMPTDKPRYVMGVGTPPQLLKMIGMGMDMFDCVMPTRLARHANVFTPDGLINLKNERFKNDAAPIMEAENYTCRNFSRAYLRHLILAKELLASTLLSIHNVQFYLELMTQARAHIQAGDYDSGVPPGLRVTKRVGRNSREHEIGFTF